MTNDDIPAAATPAVANDKITALATAGVAFLIAMLVVAGPEALAFAELLGRVAVSIWHVQMFLAVRIADSTLWLVTLQWA
jgi:hypothetical protein